MKPHLPLLAVYWASLTIRNYVATEHCGIILLEVLQRLEPMQVFQV